MLYLPCLALATDADSLYVYDQELGVIIVLDPQGIEARRFTAEGVGGPLNTVDQMAVLDDSTMLIARSQVGRASVESIDRGTGRLRRVWFETPEDAELAEHHPAPFRVRSPRARGPPRSSR